MVHLTWIRSLTFALGALLILPTVVSAAPRTYQLAITGFKTYHHYAGFLEELNNRLSSGTLVREKKMTRKKIDVVVQTDVTPAEFKDDLATALMVGAQQTQVQIDETGEGAYAIRMQ